MFSRLHRLSSRAALLGLLSSTGCASVEYTHTGNAYPPRDSNCEFTAYFKAPNEAFEELGVVTVQSGAFETFTQLEQFKEKIKPHVCFAGGDGAIVVADAHGEFVMATIIRARQ